MDELFLCVNYKIKVINIDFSREVCSFWVWATVARELWKSLEIIDSDISQV